MVREGEAAQGVCDRMWKGWEAVVGKSGWSFFNELVK
jgi:hypothetical protein